MKPSKTKNHFICSECGKSYSKWQGQCLQCKQWNCIQEELLRAPSTFGKELLQKPIALNSQNLQASTRVSTKIQELDRVLGGGLVAGSYILLGGAPGMGKSTLLLQMSEQLAEQGLKVFYVSAEESLQQSMLRAHRLGLKNKTNIFMLNEMSLENIFHHTQKLKPDILIIDSIQTVHLSELSSSGGSVSQVKECASQLMNFAKKTQTTVFVIGHITKDGQLAGPRLLEHTVDTVLSFDGDPHYQFRLLRALKNRFGAINELGVFQMSKKGLKEVDNPSEFFLEERQGDLTGSVVFTAMEGSRPLLCEIQALTLKSHLPLPRRTALGLDINRLHMISAVLDRYLNIGLSQCDIFLNTAGGLKITEPTADLAIAHALISAKSQKPVPKLSCFFGEIGLTGEIRASTFSEERIKEAQKLGFKKVYLPLGNKKHLDKKDFKDLELRWVQSLKDLV